MNVAIIYISSEEVFDPVIERLSEIIGLLHYRFKGQCMVAINEEVIQKNELMNCPINEGINPIM